MEKLRQEVSELTQHRYLQLGFSHGRNTGFACVTSP